MRISLHIKHHQFAIKFIISNSFLNFINRSPVLLAASDHKRCSSLVCSCYVAARNSDSKEEENIKNGNINDPNKPRFLEKREGFLTEFCASNESQVRDQFKKNGARTRSNRRFEIEPMPLKSNLKKPSDETLEYSVEDQLKMGSRKVSWPDSHGKDIAHVQEFEPSVSEDGELRSVRNSCVCVIQ